MLTVFNKLFWDNIYQLSMASLSSRVQLVQLETLRPFILGNFWTNRKKRNENHANLLHLMKKMKHLNTITNIKRKTNVKLISFFINDPENSSEFLSISPQSAFKDLNSIKLKKPKTCLRFCALRVLKWGRATMF